MIGGAAAAAAQIGFCSRICLCKRLDKANKDITILHPGPINRGVELESEVADSDCALILNQVTNGVAIRMAALYLLSGGEMNYKIES